MSIVNRNQPFDSLRMRLELADQAPYLGRLWKRIKRVQEQEGTMAAGGVATALMTMALYATTFAYYSLEGAGRSLEETYTAFREEGKLVQAIGDAGGWIALPIFSMISYTAALKKYVHAGEFGEVEELCRNWVEETFPDRRDIPLDAFYDNIGSLLDRLAPRCYVYKSLVGRNLIALNIVMELDARDLEVQAQSKLQLDKRLKDIYASIEKERKDMLCFSKFPTRLKTGLSATYERYGARRVAQDAITGVAIPIILCVTCLFSAMGEVELGKKVLGRNEDLPERGHFGEWPDNLVAAFMGAYLLNNDLVLKGDMHLLKKIFRRHLAALQPAIAQERDLHNRLCDVANEELQQLGSTGFLSGPVQFDEFHPL